MTVFNLSETHLRRRTSLKWRTYPEDVLPMWVAEMDVDLHPAVSDALHQALANSDTGYPSGTAYQQAFLDFAATRWHWEIAEPQIQRGSDVMNNILAVLLGYTNPGDRVVINTPIYPPFRQVVVGYQRHLVAVPMRENRLDLDALEAVFQTRPAAYLLCSPHNPNGTVHTRTELERVAELADTYGVLVIVDEIHAPLTSVPFTPYLSVSPHGVAITSAGKSWNLAAFKAGLIMCGAAQTDSFFTRLPPLATQSSGHWATIAHTAALTHARDWLDQVNAEIVTHRQHLTDLLAKHLPLARYQMAEGTYLAWVDCSAYHLGNAADHFLTHGRVAFSDGSQFAADHAEWVRINLATSPAIIEQGIQRAASSL